jgi:LPXTG-motif cell wall-anchored protein
VKKFLTLSLISTVVLSGLAPNLAYATEGQQAGEQSETANSVIQSEATSESTVNSTEVQEQTTDSLSVEQEVPVTAQSLSTTDNSEIEVPKKARVASASRAVTFPTTIAEIFPDPNLALYMASSNGLDIPIDEEITQDVLTNWLGNSLAMTGTNKDHYFELTPMWGDIQSLEGLQYLTNIQEVKLSLSGGNVASGDLTILAQMPQLNKINLDADLLTDASLTVLAQLPNLKELALTANLTDLTPMNQPNVQIEKLKISHNPVTSLEPLRAMTKLKELDCSQTGVADLAGIESLPLERLNVAMNTSLSDISAVATIKTLKELNASFCNITDITPVEALTSLNVLALAMNKITNIDPVKDLVNLEYLALGYNQISDITPVQNLVNIKDLAFESNQISDIKALKNMTQLVNIGLTGNKVSDIRPLKGAADTLEQAYLDQNKILDFSIFQSSTSVVLGADQEIHVIGKRTGEQIVLTNPARSTDGSILKPVTISDNGTYNEATNQITWTNIPTGTEVSYTFDQVIGDLNGMELRLSGTVYVDGSEDDVPPVITADDKISYEVNSTVTADDFLKGVHATTDDGSPIESDFDQVVDLTTPGSYEVTLTAKDAAGNEATPVKVTVTVTQASDTTAPVITADDKISYEVNSTVTADDFLKGVHATTDDGSPIESDFDQVVDLTTPGSYEVTLTAKDAVGNEATPVKVTVIVSEPTKDPDDDQNIEDDKPVPPGDSEEPKDQPKDSSNDEPKNNTNDPSSNQKTEEPVKSTDTHSNGSVSATNHQYHTSLPSTGETRSTMYTIFLGVFLLAGSFYGFFQKKKYLKK